MSDLMAPPGQSSVHWQGHIGMVQQQDKRFVQFYRGLRLNGVSSQAAGRPIYDPVDMVKIIHPGEKDVHTRIVREDDKYEFARQWAAFQAGFTDEAQSGTPISVLFPQEPELVTMMQGMHIYTLEQLAGLTAHGKSRLGMGAEKYVQRAVDYLEHANRMAPTNKLQAELDAERDKVATLSRQMDEMRAMMDELKANQRRPPGRPPRQQEEE